MRVLQVGLGRWGANHLRAWRRLGVELLVSDTNAELVAAQPEDGDADARSLLDAVDCVDIVTPADSHAHLIELALEAGKHVLVEKPIAPSSAEGFRLAALARSLGLILQVGHVFRFAPELRVVFDALRAGRIGAPRYVTAHFLGFKRPRNDGGVSISDAIHLVDVVSWLIGRGPDRVTAVVRDLLGRSLDDLAFLTLELGDCLAHIEAGYFPPEPRRDVVVIGSEGALACDLLARSGRLRVFEQTHRRGDDGAWDAISGASSELPFAADEPLLEELRAFLDACATGRPSALAADGFAGAAAVAVIEAAQRSATTRRAVELKPLEPVMERA